MVSVFFSVRLVGVMFCVVVVSDFVLFVCVVICVSL